MRLSIVNHILKEKIYRYDGCDKYYEEPRNLKVIKA